MKAFLISIITVVSSSPSFAKAQTSNGVDFNRGFCVQAGDKLSKENALVTIDGGRLNGTRGIRANNFFDPYFGPEQIMLIDWGGSMILRKTKNNRDGTFYASYENRLHGSAINPTGVLCVAEAKSLPIGQFELSNQGEGNNSTCQRAYDDVAQKAKQTCFQQGYNDYHLVKVTADDCYEWAGITTVYYSAIFVCLNVPRGSLP